MSVLSTVLQSRAVAALASPHGVDRFLEQVNPLWAAHEVRGRVVGGPREGHPQPLDVEVLGQHVDHTGIPPEHGHPRVGTSLLHRREARRAGHGRRSALA